MNSICNNKLCVCNHIFSEEYQKIYPKKYGTVKFSGKNIPIIPECITHLDWAHHLVCVESSITKITKLPPNLKSLNCFRNKISTIKNVPYCLKLLDISGNKLSGFVDFSKTCIEHLDVSFNKITFLKCPQTVKYLNVGDNSGINYYIPFDSKIKHLNMRSCNYTGKLKVPNGLITLIANNNKINCIEHLPNSITLLNVTGNKINKIKKLPNNLESLYISSNNLKGLLIFYGKTLKQLFCSSNDLSYLILNKNMRSVVCNDNPKLISISVNSNDVIIQNNKLLNKTIKIIPSKYAEKILYQSYPKEIASYKQSQKNKITYSIDSPVDSIQSEEIDDYEFFVSI